MQTRFRAFGVSELPNIEFRQTADEAVELAKERLLELKAKETIIVEEVRDPQLRDFVDPTQFISMVRERMSEVIGNDDALSDPEMVARMTNEVIDNMFPLIDLIGETIEIRIDGYVIVSGSRVENWWPV